MFRRLWQSGLIGLARSEDFKNCMQSWSSSSQLASRYVGGSSPEEGGQVARQLSDANIRASLFFLGEYVDSQDLVDLNVQAKSKIIQTLKSGQLDVHVSIDPTQIGFSIDRSQGRNNAIYLAREIDQVSRHRKDGVHCLMIDMEDASVVDDTLALHDEIVEQGLPVAQTLQAYLRRTPKDMALKIEQGAKVRLVKGAFVAGSDVSFTKFAEIKEAYRQLARQMLSPTAKDAGFYPIFATHDHLLHAEIIQEAETQGWQPHEYEFEMLYGARPDVAQRLAERGQRIRLYLPFGKDWWPYAVRRIAENPHNAMLLARSFLKR